MKKLASFALAIAALISTTSFGFARPPQPDSPADKIAPWVMQHITEDSQTEVLIVLGERADLSGADNLPTKADKGRFVRDALWNTAQAAQKPLQAWLQVRGVEYRPFYIVNALWAKADRDTVLALAQRPDVARVEGNPSISNFKFQISNLNFAPYASQSIEPGVAQVRAPEVWAAGFTGQGIVVGGQDTGYEWAHPALQPHYRGWDGVTVTHDYNWHDSIHSGGGSCGADSAQPCDDYGHGTHTLGTAVGDDGAGNQVGMAPGAKWIGCRNMDQGFGTPAAYLECFEFFLAPYPMTGTAILGDPSRAPDVTVNSWSCPASEGCAWGTLQQAVEAQRAAGIMTVVAATNNGYSCSSIKDPPAVYAAAYTVGALNTGADTQAGFSNQGPVTADGSGRRKPDIAAPGTNTRSSTRGGGYGNMSGTSMATPHVAGAVALLWSARPALKNQITLTEQILNASAVHLPSGECGSAGWPNNTFGYGRLDISTALDYGLLTSVITDAITAAPIISASVQATLNATYTFSATSDIHGAYSLALISGTYTVTASAPGFRSVSAGGVSVASGVTTTHNVALPSFKHYIPLCLRP